MLLPDIILLLLFFAVLGVELVRKDGSVVFQLTWITLVFTFFLCLGLAARGGEVAFGSLLISGFSLVLKAVFTLSALLAVLLSRSSFRGSASGRKLGGQAEFYLMILASSCGMFVVASATELLTLFVGMELATVPLYVLSGFKRRDERSLEGAVKYIVTGSLATGISLYGYSLLYGAAGGIGFAELKEAVAAAPADPLLWLGTLAIFLGVGFKLTLFPFHFWAPDVYEGAPMPVAAYLSVSSKAAAVALLLVLLYGPLAPLRPSLAPMIAVFALLTMTVGNLGALRQANLKRFMAYSSIAQAGYILVAMVGEGESALTSILFYLVVYAVANYAAFFVFASAGEERRGEFASLRGLGKSRPALAAVLMLAMFSLAGIPPLAGFVGKFMLFAAAAEQGLYWLVVAAALQSTVSLYYYLLVVREAYIVPGGGMLAPIHPVHRGALVPLTAAMVLLGLTPHLGELVSLALR